MKHKTDVRDLIASNFKRLRLAAGKKQQEVADYLGVTKQSISAVERGIVGVDLKTAYQLCDLFECKIEDFIAVEWEARIHAGGELEFTTKTYAPDLAKASAHFRSFCKENGYTGFYIR